MTIMMRMSAGLSMERNRLRTLDVVEAIALAEGLFGLGEAGVSRRVACFDARSDRCTSASGVVWLPCTLISAIVS